MKLIRNTLLGLYINLFLVAWLWINLFQGLLGNNMGNWVQWLLIAAIVISGILNVIFAVKNIINTYLLYRDKEYNNLRKCMKILKFAVIPYFILNFAIYFLLFAIFFAASRGIMIFSPIPLFFLIPVFFTYLSVLFTSSYGIGFALINTKEKRLKKGTTVIHILLQLCFVLDVIGTIILLIKYKAQKTNE